MKNSMILEQNSLQFYLGELAEKNYYNEKHHIVRIKFNNSYFDMHLYGYTIEKPDPKYHLVIFLGSERMIGNYALNENDLKQPPGIDMSSDINKVPFGIAFLINKTQKLTTTNPPTGTAGFAIRNTNFYDQDKVRVSLTPPLDKDYTSIDSDIEADRNDNIGIFINDDTILIKTRGSSITLGDEGMHVGGEVSWENASHGKGIMMRNQFAELIPSSIPTAVLATPNIPNISEILMFAEAGQRVLSVVNKAAKITELVS